MTSPTIEGTNELMRNKNTSLILATGNTPMVKAAYSSGTPAYGVGPGNVPAFIERTANVKKAVADVFTGKTFDNGVLCSTESAVIVDSPLNSIVRDEFIKRKCYFVNQDEKIKLEKWMFRPGGMNPELVGKPAPFIAQKAGFNVPVDTEILLVELNGVGKEHPLSAEKLSPVLSYYVVDGWREGCERCIQLLEFGGIGHTMVIHSTDKDIIMKFALEKPAYRILVNTVGSLGAAGYTNFLTPSLTLGPGTIGGSIISVNVTASHLLNIKRLAFETKPMNDKDGNRINSENGKTYSSTGGVSGGRTWMDEIEERIRLKAGNTIIKKEESGKSSFKSGMIYGSGMTESEVEKVIKTFKK
jgi:acetaldehyde dehydrogenase (acetylating)